jgi:hypothetical protein
VSERLPTRVCQVSCCVIAEQAQGEKAFNPRDSFARQVALRRRFIRAR